MIVGRERDLLGVVAGFEAGARVITLVGPGGIGKSRLAAEVVARHRDEYTADGSGGAWWCELTEAKSAMAVCAALASTLRWRLDPSLDEDRVIARLGTNLSRRKRLLLVLDNCEHIASAVAETVRGWLAAAPHLRVLVTSRVPLAIAGEQTYQLGALDEAPAIELFSDRARQQHPAFEITEADRAAIAEIVNRLDRVPLAIELAAVRARTMSLAQILERIQQPVALLEMRGIVLDSYRMLPDEARSVFASCSVFRGGFALPAAEAILPGTEVWSTLDTLCQHSLLRIIPGNPPRFQLFEMMREVALELRAPDDDVVERHAVYFAGLATRLAQQLDAGDEAALDGLELELENLIAAHRGEHAHAISLGLDPLLAKRGLFRIRLRLLDQTLGTPHPERVRVLLARGATLAELGEIERAASDFAEALELATERGDVRNEAIAVMHIGTMAETAGDTAAAREHYERGLAAIAQAPPSRATTILTAELHAHRGHALRREHQLEAADRDFARSLELYRAIRERAGIAGVCYEAGVVAWFRGDLAVAREWFSEGLELARALGARQLEAALITGRGEIAQEQGALDEAIAACAVGVQVFRDLGNRHREASALYYLGGAYLERGDVQQADGLLEQAVSLATAVGASRYVALIRGLQCVVHASRGRDELARRAADAADVAALACASEPGVAATVRLHRLHLAPVGAADPAIETPSTIENDDTRFARRLLRARLRSAPGQRSLVIGEDGATFQLPEGDDVIDLARRAPLRRLVLALARHRVESPGEALGLDDLLEAGWPGEHIAHEAAVNRLHVALATLRKLGLRTVLLTGERGYLLDPTVPITLLDQRAAEQRATK